MGNKCILFQRPPQTAGSPAWGKLWFGVCVINDLDKKHVNGTTHAFKPASASPPFEETSVPAEDLKKPTKFDLDALVNGKSTRKLGEEAAKLVPVPYEDTKETLSKLEEGPFDWLKSLNAKGSDADREELLYPLAGMIADRRSGVDGSGPANRSLNVSPEISGTRPTSPLDRDRANFAQRLTATDGAESSQQTDSELFQRTEGIRLYAEPPRSGLISGIWPYVGAAFFFAIVAGGAVFYFAVIRMPNGSQPNTSSAYSSPGDDVAGQTQAPASNKRTRASPTEQSVETQPGIAPAIVTDKSPSDSNPKPFVFGTPNSGPPANSFASAVLANLKKSNEPVKLVDTKPAGETAAGNETRAQSGTASPFPMASSPAIPATTTTVASPARTEPALRSLNLPVEKQTAQQEAAQTAPPPPVEARVPAPSNKPNREPSSGQTASLPQDRPSPAAAPAPSKPRMVISPDQESEMLARGRETLQEGDIAGARLLFQYLADQGSASGAYVMGQTYDPAMLASLGVRGLKGDPKAAKFWYEKAANLGSDAARQKLGSR